MEKNINLSINSKVLAVTALGAGVLVGAGTAYVLTRIHEHSNLTHLVSHLHTTIKEVKDEIAHLENELGLLHLADQLPEEKPLRKKHRKAVSFSSTATSSSYKTTFEPASDTASFKTANASFTDTDSCRISNSYDTDYFSPDEDDDEFFDISPTDDEGEVVSFPLRDESTGDFSEDASALTRLLGTVDHLIDRSPEEQIQAYHLLMNSEYGENAEILWRKAKATRNMSVIEEARGNMSDKKDLLNEAFEYATRALRVNDKSAEVHKWFSILSGARGEFLSTKERIASGHVFKEHIDIALRISPNDSTLHHLLGRFCFEVSLLTWVERKVASTLFGEVPSSSYSEALDHFEAAEELKPTGWKENKLFIAKCHLKLGDLLKGERWLREALGVPTLTANDEIMNKEIQELFKQYYITL